MRLIDADEMIKNLKAMKTMYDAIELDGMIKGLEESKTVDAEPVRHGRWDDSGRYKFKDGRVAVRCTECGCVLSEDEFKKYAWVYCPICGAKMDGGETHAAD